LAFFEVEVMSGGVNVALGKMAEQSSTLIDEGNIPSLAIDAVDGDLTTSSHTDCNDPWWVVDLGELFPIEEIVIINYWCDDLSDTPGCLCMLSNATLSLLDGDNATEVDSLMIGDTCGVHELSYNFCTEITEAPNCAPTAKPTLSPTEMPTVSPSLSLSPTKAPSLSPTDSPTDPQCDYPEARYVKIHQNITMEQLSMFEVLVFSDGTNVALNKSANQSSTLVEGSIARLASYAIDSSLTSFSHTDCSDPWWIVDLGCMMPIELVTIMNHWCEDPSDAPGCLCMMSNATLSLLDDHMAVVQTKEIGNTCGVDEISFNFCADATESPDCAPTAKPTASPVEIITDAPTQSPITSSPSIATPASSSDGPTASPSHPPTTKPSNAPSQKPSTSPSSSPSQKPSTSPSIAPSQAPTASPTDAVITTSAPTPAIEPVSPIPPPIVVSVFASMALDNFVMPANQQEYGVVVSILEVTLRQAIESSLSEGQSLYEVSVTSLGGQTGVRHRFLESTEVQYVMTLEESCTIECDNAATDLYNSVTSQLRSSVESGSFTTDLTNNASTNAKAASLANVSVHPPSFKMQSESSQSPTRATITNPPTLRPSSAPSSQSSQALPAPQPKHTSSGGMLSTSGFYAIVSIAAVFLTF
jgi:hypothetical protein